MRVPVVGSRLALLALVVAIVSCHRNRNALISEAELIAFDKSFYSKSRMSGKHQILGILHNHRILVDYPCNDLCPDETDRVIHFDVDAGPQCEVIGGASWNGFLSSGDASSACIPKVIYHH